MGSRASGAAWKPVAAAALALAVALGAAGPAWGASAPTPTSVTARLVLARSQVRSGRMLRGTLVLTNHTKHSLDLNDGCTPRWEVVLGQGRKAPEVAFSLVCGTASFRVAPGANKEPFTVSTSGMPAGRYRAFLVASDPKFPTARPVAVTIVGSS